MGLLGQHTHLSVLAAGLGQGGLFEHPGQVALLGKTLFLADHHFVRLLEEGARDLLQDLGEQALVLHGDQLELLGLLLLRRIEGGGGVALRHIQRE